MSAASHPGEGRGLAEEDAGARPGPRYVIEVEGTGTSYPCAEDDTLLRAGLRAGLGLAYECNVGSCGTCKFQLLAGEVDALWEEAPGLTPRDRERGRRLACQSRPRSDCTVKMMLADEFVPRSEPRRFVAGLVESVPVTHDMREFRLRGPHRATFAAGQYALFRLPGVPGVRAYSMSNLENDRGEWHFVIRRLPHGAMTTVLFDELREGDPIELDGPYGLAYLRADRRRDIVCIAGGSGLSPMVSVARGFAREPALARTRLHFFYGGRGPRDICGENMLRELPGFGDRISYHPIISMPELDEAEVWRGERGFVHELVERWLDGGLDQYEYYLAGPPPMVQETLKLLMARHKVPVQQIHYDRFF